MGEASARPGSIGTSLSGAHQVMGDHARKNAEWDTVGGLSHEVLRDGCERTHEGSRTSSAAVGAGLGLALGLLYRILYRAVLGGAGTAICSTRATVVP